MTFYDGADLKKRFVEATDFAAFHEYYMSHFVESGNFMSLGRTLSAPRSQFLNMALAEAYGKVADAASLAIRSHLVEIPELGLIHGAIDINGKLASVLYFDNISMGMFVVLENSPGKMNYMRFTAARPTSGKPN